ncbi:MULTISPECIES: hypothetical protein [unclassified Frondihabitans]|uniref:hypothetical protein n=1 Tax=unclassified Frondihabitans TaxID=2626248 RepID=UPI000F4DD4BB|nr:MULTISPECIES: hypothetical protein [unclassified Frondihabitans]RPE76447.1 hypothetical protein EDF37_2272 [Frondihabitans sp. PhB153]RPF05277.1 hypothetical protein EDF39_1976 [Frondihabitans sp. PhB161]
MTTAFTLPDSLSLGDLHTFLARAAAVDDGAVRLIGAGGLLAAYVGVLSPAGLLDTSPTVLGLRTYALAEGSEATFDAVVPIRSVQERLVRLQNEVVDPTAAVVVALPPVVIAASWAAISPPRGGWQAAAAVDAAVLEATAKAGIDEVARVIPTGTGEQIVQKVRSGVWTRPIDGTDGVPAGAAFAALTLGFLSGEEPTRVFTVGAWTRLSTSRGHVLVKRRSSLL